MIGRDKTMTEHRENEEELPGAALRERDLSRLVFVRYEKERLTIVIDAVVAISLTILGVEFPSAIATDRVIAYLGVYLLSYAIICKLWTTHVSMFGNDVDRIRPVALTLTVFWLFFLAAIAFQYSVFSSFLDSDEKNEALAEYSTKVLLSFSFLSLLCNAGVYFALNGAPRCHNYWSKVFNKSLPMNAEKYLFILVVGVFPPFALAFGLSFISVNGAYALVLMTVTTRILHKVLGVDHEFRFEKIRLVQLNDGVIAISCTLLSLDVVKVVDGLDLRVQGFQFAYFFSSFFIVFIFWAINHGIYHNVREEIPTIPFICNLTGLFSVPLISSGFKSLFEAQLGVGEDGDDDDGSGDSGDPGADNEATNRNAMILIFISVAWYALFLMFQILYFSYLGVKHVQISNQFRGGLTGNPKVSVSLRKTWARYYLLRSLALCLTSLIFVGVVFVVDPEKTYILFLWMILVALHEIVVYNIYSHQIRKVLHRAFRDAPGYIRETELPRLNEIVNCTSPDVTMSVSQDEAQVYLDTAQVAST